MRKSRPSPAGGSRLRPALGALRAALQRDSAAGFGLALLCVVTGAVLAASAPVAMKLLLDELGAPGGHAAGLVLIYAGCLGLARLAGEGRSYFYGRAEQEILRTLSLRVFTHVMALPMRFHSGRATGSLVQCLDNGLQGYRLLLQHGIFTLLPGIIELVVIAGILLWFLEGAFLAIVAACAIAYAGVFVSGARKVLSASQDVSAARTQTSAQLTDVLLNLETVKVFNGAPAMSRRFDLRLDNARLSWRRFYAIRCRNGVMAALVFTAGLLSVLLLAADRVGRGDMTAGDLVLVSLYMMQVARPMELLGFAARDIGQGAAFVERLNELLAEEPETRALAASQAVTFSLTPMAISIENVSFAHSEGSGGLRDLALEIPAGTKLALVGPSGSGKSTLIRLLLKFHEPDSGRILVDGRSLADFHADLFREQIGFIGQEPGLFNDSLAFNVGYPTTDRMADDIQEVLARVCMADMEQRSFEPGGNPVGERGSHLSGGEKQRIAIARLLLRRPRLILADEPTSALDPQTEAVILRELEAAAHGATLIIASHRLRTVQNADLIAVMSHGQIAETGSHEALLARNGLYAQMWNAQDGGLV